MRKVSFYWRRAFTNGGSTMSDDKGREPLNIADDDDPVSMMLDVSWNHWIELQLSQEAFLTSRALIDIYSIRPPEGEPDLHNVALATLFWGAWNTPQRLTVSDFAKKVGIEIEEFKAAARAIRKICAIEGAIEAEDDDDTPFNAEEE